MIRWTGWVKLAKNTLAVSRKIGPPAPGKLSAEAERGKALFFGEANCAKCHSGPYYTDSKLEKPYNLHDVGTGDAKDEKKK